MSADRIKELRARLERRRGERDWILSKKKLEEKKLVETKIQQENLIKAAEVVQSAVEVRRQEIRDRVENLVTRGLRAVFGDEDMTFAFNLTLRGGLTGLIPVLKTKFGDKELETSITEGHGGGVADVIAFLLRVVVMSLTRPVLSPVMVLDESFSHVSTDCIRRCASLVRELNEVTGIQFILVTHREELLDAADVIYRTEVVKGATRFHLEHDMRDEAYHKRPKGDELGRQRGTGFDGLSLVGSPGQKVPLGKIKLNGRGRTVKIKSEIAVTTDAWAQKQRWLSKEARKRKKPTGLPPGGRKRGPKPKKKKTKHRPTKWDVR